MGFPGTRPLRIRRCECTSGLSDQELRDNSVSLGVEEYNGDSLSRRIAKGMIRPLRMGKYLARKGIEQRELGEEEL